MSVLIFGYGTTGKSIESYLVKNNINYFIFDDNEEAIVGKRNKFTLNKLENIDLVYISPGISPSHSLYKQLKNKNIEIKTDLDLFFEKINYEKIITIGVTGTNGKTSFVSLVEEFLKNKNLKTESVGNIGKSPISLIEEINNSTEKTYLLIELSSFQLFYSKKLELDYGILLNITEDHLDWHLNIDEYIESKNKIFSFIKEDNNKMLNLDNDSVETIYSSHPEYINNLIEKGFHENTVLNFFKLISLLLPGREIIDKGFNFLLNQPNLEHRFEIIENSLHHIFINDSKSTNLSSVQFAISKLNNLKKIHDANQIILILHGDNKGIDFSKLDLNEVDTVFYTKNFNLIKNEKIKKIRYESLKDIKESLEKKLNTKSIVLFSCGGSSFTEFKNYKERGVFFKNLIKNMEIGND